MGEHYTKISLSKRPSGELRLTVSTFAADDRLQANQGAQAPLSIASKYKVVRPGFGALPRDTEFSARSRRSVREGAAAIERQYGKQNCRFLTGTLPGSTNMSMEYMSRYSGWITQQVTQFLRDCAGDLVYVYVWELQKRGALHAHCLVAHTDGRVLERLRQRWRKFWVHTLVRLSVKSGIDMFATSTGHSHIMTPHVVRADCQRVRVSISRYLSKYLSKGESKSAMRTGCYPSRWWSCSRAVLGLVNSFCEGATRVLAKQSKGFELWKEIATELHRVADVSFLYRNPVLVGQYGAVAYIGSANSDIVFDYLCDKFGLRTNGLGTPHFESTSPAGSPLRAVAQIFGVVHSVGAA